jgi:beta-glucanase (GH16 family)
MLPEEHLGVLPPIPAGSRAGCCRPVLVPEMNRRSAMLTFGIGALATAIPAPIARAYPSRPETPPRPAPAPTAPAPGAQTGGFLFHDEFDGPAGSAPDPSKWVVSSNRTPVKNPVGFDRPEFWGQYRDSRENVFLDGNSNLVLRATRDGDKYFGGLVSGNWRGGIGTTWEARIKLNCLTGGPASRISTTPSANGHSTTRTTTCSRS